MIASALIVALALLVGLVAAGRALHVQRAHLSTDNALLRELLAEVVDALKVAGGPQEVEQSMRIAELEHAVDLLPQKWEEFRHAARRSEDRARKIVQSAREELEQAGFEHAGVEAQASELQLVDGSGSGLEGVQPVPQSVESDVPDPTDWREVARRRKFGA